MTDDNQTVPANNDDIFDSEEFQSVKQGLVTLQESHRGRCRRMKQEITELKASKEKYERDWRYEARRRDRDNQEWQRKHDRQTADLTALKHEAANLRRQKKALTLEIKAKRHELERLAHLFCDICCDTEKSRVTKCGHGFCVDCLTKVFDDTDVTAGIPRLEIDGLAIVKVATCPMCRAELQMETDVWPIYLSSGV
ncbi:hypothetical protein LTR70_004866 [Exophiala xenobiotica]|uniref:RING-type domain-containing protein n=1 Tax=Lithohypha guttulata TaxID=1690604 RepID=A0ABR0KBY9_9EURO|nr:hypothetical protein LTR24_004484 [Lithohypha guttulata]KAK5319821.1 hypothetical protein LTR70_004866 [Exophiala xenobiotica]